MWRLTDTSAMPYGKYKGRPMSGVPADYLLWLHENGKCSESVARYIEEHKPAIEQRRDTEAADRKLQGRSNSESPCRVSTGHV